MEPAPLLGRLFWNFAVPELTDKRLCCLVSYDFTPMWNLRNTTGEHRGREGKIRKSEREANHKRLLNTENKPRVDGGRDKGEGKIGDGH